MLASGFPGDVPTEPQKSRRAGWGDRAKIYAQVKKWDETLFVSKIMNISLNEKAYSHICQLLLENRVSPMQRLSEQFLAEQIGMSRTPVREAIRRLSSEGILQQIPSSGTYLMPPKYDDILKNYEIREALECFLVKKAVPLMAHHDFKQIRRYYKEMKKAVDRMKVDDEPFLAGEPLSAFLKADWAFHRHLIEPADNQHAIKILDDAQLKGCVFGMRSHRRNLEHLARVLHLHLQIAKAVTHGNAGGAAHWLRMHIRESRRDALAAFRAEENEAGRNMDQKSSYSVIVDYNTNIEAKASALHHPHQRRKKVRGT